MKKILEYSCVDARKFFLKEKSYFNFDLPKYFVFQSVLDKVSQQLDGKSLNDFYKNEKDVTSGKHKPKYPCNHESVNYVFLNNKDGKYAWRPLQLIHPALYVSLVHSITEENNWNIITNRFKEFDKNPKISCSSLPIEAEKNSLESDKAEMVSSWWQLTEQKSIELALKFEYLLHTDIADCYGSIYTHSIAWAIHTKQIGKDQRSNKKLIGNIIDKHLQDMAFGQTNGIPQGSVLMDLIAEMVLGFADLQLLERVNDLKLDDYKIIRYRDDYRVFTNNPCEAEVILKCLTEILIELGLRLNSQKTSTSNNVIQTSIKPDKLYYILNKKTPRNLQDHLILIHDLSCKFPNSGSLSKALMIFYKKIKKLRSTKQNVCILISIVVNIALKNPRTYPICSAILSKFLSLIEEKQIQYEVLDSIAARFSKIPNVGHLEIWLQRAILKIAPQREFDEKLCKKLNDETICIWNSDWLSKKLSKIIENEPII